MAKFKKGDRVRLISDKWSDLRAGATGTVVESGSHSPWVEWDGYRGGYDSTFGDGRKSVLAVDEDRIELLVVSDTVPVAVEPILFILIAAGRITQEQVDAARLLVEG